MPRFDIQQQQTVINPSQASSNAFGSGSGTASLGQAFGQVADVIHAKSVRDERLKLQKDLTKASIDWTRRQKELEESFPDGEGLTDAFKEEFGKYNKEFLRQYKGQSREEAELRLFDLEARLEKDLIIKQGVMKSQAEVASFESDRDVIANQVSSGEMDASFAMSVLDGRSDAMTMLNPSIRGDIRQETENIIGTSHVLSVLQNEGPIAADDELKDKFLEGLSPNVKSSIKTKIKSRASTHVRQGLGKAKRSLDAGYPVGDLRQEIAMATRFGFQEEAGVLRRIRDIQSLTNELVKEPLPDNLDKVRELDALMRSGKGTDDDLFKLSAFRSALKVKNEMLRADPYQWIERSGYWDLPILEADVTGDMTEVINQRRSIQQQVRQNEGVQIPIFRPEEVDQIVQMMKSSGPEDQVAILQNLTMQIDSNEIAMTAQQIAPKSVEMGAAMVNVENAPDVTRDILMGRKRDIPTPANKKFDEQFLNAISTAIEDETARQQALASVKAVYKEDVFRNLGDQALPDDIDTDAFERSIERVLGPVIEYRNYKTLSFRTDAGSYLSENDFEDVLDGATSELIMQTHGDVPRMESGQPLDVERMFKRMNLVAIGDGLYMIRDQNGNHAKTEDGRVFELNMRELHKNSEAFQSSIEPEFFRGRR